MRQIETKKIFFIDKSNREGKYTLILFVKNAKRLRELWFAGLVTNEWQKC